jgi:hypothetical protein
MYKSYLTNFALETNNDHYVFYSSHSLDHKFSENYDDIIDKCHIYCVVDCPRVTFIPNTLEYEVIDNVLFFNVEMSYRFQGEIKNIRIVDNIDVLDNRCRVEIDEFPYTNIIIKDMNDKFLMSRTATSIAYHFGIEDITTMKVLYVGKSTGIKKKKNALERADGHEKIGKISLDWGAKHPDRSILVGFFDFPQIDKPITFADYWDFSRLHGEENEKRVRKISNFEMSLREQTLMIEMALIRYFQPEYNTQVKNDLPSQDSVSLKKCYEYDITAILVKFWTQNEKNEKLKYFLYSDTVGKSSKHDISIELVDPEVRKGIYSVGGTNIAPKGTIRRNKKKI